MKIDFNQPSIVWLDNKRENPVIFLMKTTGFKVFGSDQIRMPMKEKNYNVK